MEFWIKVPLIKEYNDLLENNGHYIPLITKGYKNKKGWGVMLKGKNLRFVIFTQNMVPIELKYNNIVNNTWTKVSISNKPKAKTINLYVDGKPVDVFKYDWVPKDNIVSELNKRIHIRLPIDDKTGNFSIV